MTPRMKRPTTHLVAMEALQEVNMAAHLNKAMDSHPKVNTVLHLSSMAELHKVNIHLKVRASMALLQVRDILVDHLKVSMARHHLVVSMDSSDLLRVVQEDILVSSSIRDNSLTQVDSSSAVEVASSWLE